MATVNAGPPGLELGVYVPVWSVAERAAEQETTGPLVLSAVAGSAVLVAAAHEQIVSEGGYPRLVRLGSVPALLSDRGAGSALGPAELRLVSAGWEPIGLGAIADVVQDAFGPVELDRSPVELSGATGGAADCPACRGQRFGFPAGLTEARALMCPGHYAEADTLITSRLERAESSNPEGWAALREACARLELPTCPMVWPASWQGPRKPCSSSPSLRSSAPGPGW